MISDRELDGLLRSWLAAPGAEPAPIEFVRAALIEVGHTPQRRGVLGRLLPGLMAVPRLRVVVLVGLLAILLAVAVGVGALVTNFPVVRPTATMSTDSLPSINAATHAPSQATSIVDPGGRYEIKLPDPWAGEPTADGYVVARRAAARLTAVAGDADGRFRTCLTPAGPWEECAVVQARTLDELERVTAVEPVLDHDVGPPVITRATATVDGEPAILVHIEAYEYPARGGQWLEYILVVHDARPYYIRIRNTDGDGLSVDDVLAGFRFLD
jgi:hypothetical protein